MGYRSPSHSSAERDNFLSRFEQLLNDIKNFKPSFIIILSDFKGTPSCLRPSKATENSF